MKNLDALEELVKGNVEFVLHPTKEIGEKNRELFQQINKALKALQIILKKGLSIEDKEIILASVNYDVYYDAVKFVALSEEEFNLIKEVLKNEN